MQADSMGDLCRANDENQTHTYRYEHPSPHFPFTCRHPHNHSLTHQTHKQNMHNKAAVHTCTHPFHYALERLHTYTSESTVF